MVSSHANVGGFYRNDISSLAVPDGICYELHPLLDSKIRKKTEQSKRCRKHVSSSICL